ncbi:MAG: thiamine-phosphate kinase [Candidatus Thorarchaeota archaeon]|nr:thiamine-phosphate kinase [Candidatus Thorarchaeota archaeon]
MKSSMPSEREFLQKIKHLIHSISGAKLGFDDDASDIPMKDGQHVVINVDTFVRKTDWLPEMTAAQAGRKTAVMTISDVVAKGATPRAAMLSLCVPKDYPEEDAEEIVRGFSQYCLKNSLSFIGGDFGIADDVVLTGVGIGFAPSGGVITRDGAKPDDILAVTGEFGLTTVAFEHLLGGKELEGQLKYDALAAVLNPHIHHDFVNALAREGAVHASMDSSDGLGITLHTMAKQSGVAFVLDNLPIPTEVMRFARNNHVMEFKFVMQGGEEFILVLSIPEEKWTTASDLAKEQKVPLYRIGYVTMGEGVRYETKEGYIDIPESGYDNVKGWD